MPERWSAPLRAARLALLLSVLAYGVILALIAKHGGSERLYDAGMVAVAGIALSAAACLILQAVVLVKWRRARRNARP